MITPEWEQKAEAIIEAGESAYKRLGLENVGNYLVIKDLLEEIYLLRRRCLRGEKRLMQQRDHCKEKLALAVEALGKIGQDDWRYYEIAQEALSKIRGEKC